MSGREDWSRRFVGGESGDWISVNVPRIDQSLSFQFRQSIRLNLPRNRYRSSRQSRDSISDRKNERLTGNNSILPIPITPHLPLSSSTLLTKRIILISHNTINQRLLRTPRRIRTTHVIGIQSRSREAPRSSGSLIHIELGRRFPRDGGG